MKIRARRGATLEEGGFIQESLRDSKLGYGIAMDRGLKAHGYGRASLREVVADVRPRARVLRVLATGEGRAEKFSVNATPKTDPRVDAYIEKAAPFAQPILRRLRAVVHRACPAATETIKWGMPHFEHAGAILCNMAAFKAHGAFGFWHQGMEKLLAAEGALGRDAMGSLGRITGPKDLPTDASLTRWVRAAAKLNESGASARSRPKRGVTPELPVPADLAAVLNKNPAAARAFAGFSPSHRKEYIEWIAEAKREETRKKRVSTTLEWLAEGKPRNWKYLNC